MPKKQSASRQQSKVEELGHAFIELKNIGEFKKFIRDLCTLEEIEEMGKRWQAVKLIEGGMPYRDIAKELGLSTTTVSRCAHWLRHGQGGYRLILRRMK